MLDANAMARIRLVRGADGHLYIHDPDFRFPQATHVHIPQHTDYRHTEGYRRDGLSGPRGEEKRQQRIEQRHNTRRAVRDMHRYWETHGTHSFGEPDLLHFGQTDLNRTLQGLGSVTPLEQGATLALNFIPGVGPILSGIASIAEGLLGGGDPTPEYKLEEEVLQLREAIAQAHQALGIPDSFQLAGAIGSGANDDVMRKAVTEALGHPGSGPTWRNDLYTAISNLQHELQPLSQQANNTEVADQVLAALHQSPVVPAEDSTTPPDGTGSPPASSPAEEAAAPASSMFAQEAEQYGPWVLGSAGAIAVIFLFASLIGGSGKK